jgi:hypothetical protein
MWRESHPMKIPLVRPGGQMPAYLDSMVESARSIFVADARSPVFALHRMPLRCSSNPMAIQWTASCATSAS